MNNSGATQESVEYEPEKQRKERKAIETVRGLRYKFHSIEQWCLCPQLTHQRKFYASFFFQLRKSIKAAL